MKKYVKCIINNLTNEIEHIQVSDEDLPLQIEVKSPEPITVVNPGKPTPVLEYFVEELEVDLPDNASGRARAVLDELENRGGKVATKRGNSSVKVMKNGARRKL